MSSKSNVWIGLLLSIVQLCASAENACGQEFPTNSSLLSGDVQAFFEVVDAPRMEGRWANTSLGLMGRDAVMKPFLDAQREAIRERLLALDFAVDIRLTDLQAIASGEVCLAWYQLKTKNGLGLLVDTRQRKAQTDKLLQRLDQDLIGKRGASKKQVAYAGQQMTVYTLKRKLGQINVEQFAYAMVGGRLVASDNLTVVQQILDSLQGNKFNRLVDSEPFKKVAAKVGNGRLSDVRWFVKPLQFARLLENRAGGLKKQRLDTIKLLQQQGFDAVIAAGGNVTLDDQQYDIKHTSFVLAPPVTNRPSKYRLAARMLQFVNTDRRDPPDWVMPTVATYLEGNWKMNDAFWASESLVNQAVGDVIFKPFLSGMQNDQDGPQVDIAGDIISNFEDRFILMTDNVTPVSKQSERLLVAVALKDAAVVKKTLDKIMKSDPNVFPYDYPKHQWIWEIRSAPDDEAAIEGLEGFEDFEFETDEDDGAGVNGGGKEPLLNEKAVTVYNGYLLFSSHAKMIAQTIDHHRDVKHQPQLSAQSDFRSVRSALGEIAPGPQAIYRVLRSNLAFRAKYELFKKGELRDSDSLLASVFRRLLANAKPEAADGGSVDTSKLPAFQTIQKYLFPSGTTVETEPDGWSLRGVMLKDDQGKETEAQ